MVIGVWRYLLIHIQGLAHTFLYALNKYSMKKILSLITLVIVLLGGIAYVGYNTRLNIDYKREGIVIKPPFNQLNINRDALSALSISALSSDTHLISAYYYMDDSNMDDYHFFTLNIFDLSYLFTEKGIRDEIYYGSYLESTLKSVPNSCSPYRRLIDGTPAILYHYQKDMGDNLFIPTKVAVICCNKKAYYLEVSAIGNVDKWFDKIEQAISFRDFAKERVYSIAFMIMLSIAVAVILVFVIKEVIILIKAKLKYRSKLFWSNKRACNLYRYIKITIIVGVILGLIILCDSGLGIFIILETLVKNGLILFYIRKRATQEYSEDYLVPQWFKSKFYKYLNNKAELRTILLFLYMPLFYIIPLPFGTYAIVFYIIPVGLLIGAYIGFKWIKAGKNESL